MLFNIFCIIISFLVHNISSLTLSKVNQNDAAVKVLKGKKVNDVQEKIGHHFPLGVIPYYLDSLSYDYLISERVRIVMNNIESVSCVRFKPLILKPNETYSWLNIANPDQQRECSHNPTIEDDGEILLVLGYDCLSWENILHTVLHGIGFRDEVSHPHRDQFIGIAWNNIRPEYRHLFRSQPEDQGSKPLTEYDPNSVMHFHDRAFTLNGQAVITPLVPGLQIQPNKDLSPLDKMKLRVMFGHECNKRNVGDLYDTCKNVMHGQLQSENGEIGEKGSKENEEDTYEVAVDNENAHKNETLVDKEDADDNEKFDNNKKGDDNEKLGDERADANKKIVYNANSKANVKLGDHEKADANQKFGNYENSDANKRLDNDNPENEQLENDFNDNVNLYGAKHTPEYIEERHIIMYTDITPTGPFNKENNINRV